VTSSSIICLLVSRVITLDNLPFSFKGNYATLPFS
jgi:hypothetical protein